MQLPNLRPFPPPSITSPFSDYTKSSGLICWLGIDGRLSTWTLLFDVVSFILLARLSVEHPHHHNNRSASHTLPWMERGRNLILRYSHRAVLFANLFLGLTTSNDDSLLTLLPAGQALLSARSPYSLPPAYSLLPPDLP